MFLVTKYTKLTCHRYSQTSGQGDCRYFTPTEVRASGLIVQLMQHRHVCTLTGRVADTSDSLETPIGVHWDVVIGAYSWNFDGDQDDKATETTTQHTFASPVLYTVRLKQV
jgi:hypothetical protein